MFNTDNTEGQYTAAQLAEMNSRVQELVADGLDKKNAMDKIVAAFDSENAE